MLLNVTQLYTDEHLKQTRSCFSSYYREYEELIGTGRLRTGFSLTIIFFVKQLQLKFRFIFWALFIFLCPNPIELCFRFFSLSKKLILLWGGRKDFFHVCRNVDFFPP